MSIHHGHSVWAFIMRIHCEHRLWGFIIGIPCEDSWWPFIISDHYENSSCTRMGVNYHWCLSFSAFIKSINWCINLADSLPAPSSSSGSAFFFSLASVCFGTAPGIRKQTKLQETSFLYNAYKHSVWKFSRSIHYEHSKYAFIVSTALLMSKPACSLCIPNTH